MTDPGVRLDGVSVSFDGIPALSDVSIAVDPEEFFTLVGPSGCGKTTTLRTIAGFETPDAGSVEIGGRDVTTEPPEARNVGVVFQSYALFPHMTVRENVAYGLRYRDPPGSLSRSDRVAELLELVDMSGLADRSPDSLSGGQQQRVALARALAPGPDVLLLDEPLSALDASLRERLRVTLREIQQSLGVTTVYVTHDQEEALAISDRVAVVNDGRIEQVAAPETLYRAPASRFVAEFVGDNNLFEATVVDRAPLQLGVGDATFTLDASLPADAADDVTISVRPETVRFGSGDISLEASVDQVEFLGDAYRVHCVWNDREVLVKSVGEDVPSGSVTLGVDTDDVRIV